MLNSKKQINFDKKKQGIKNVLFFSLPILPSNSFLQSNTPRNVLNDLNVVSTVTKPELSSKNFRFSPALKDFRSYRLVKKYKKQTQRGWAKLKFSIVFINHVFRKKKQNSFFYIKRIKGGFMVTSADFTSFMPRSLAKWGKKQSLLNIKVAKRRTRRRFSSKRKFKLKLNFVSTSKLLTNFTNLQQKK